MLHECFVDRFIDNVDEIALDILCDDFSFTESHLHLSFGYGDGIVGGIKAGNRFSFGVDDHRVVARMVVAEEHDVEARHLFGNA